jgi:dihydroxyacetone kinase phosphoprotein-dependent L subunit
MLQVLNEDKVRGMILYVADRIIENKPLLTEVDSKIGDGDHGIGMAGGMQKAKEAVSKTENTGNAYALFEKAGKTMLMSMGGASGVIFGSLYLAGAKGAEERAELSAGDLAAMMERSLAAIKERGKARLGDKTMVDALEPAVEAMKNNWHEGLVPMLQAASAAAEQGMENTKKYQAKFGRAKSLMERAVGFQDAGATSVWIIFRSMCEFAERSA